MAFELKALRARVWAARGIALRVLLAVVLLLVAVVVVQQALEARAAARLTATEKFASVHGAEIRYRILGDNPNASTVVFLTGLGGSIEQLEDVQTRVAKAARTISYDRAGYGFSRNSRAHDANEQVEELLGLLDALGVREPVALVCFSSSCSVARLFTGRFRDRVAGMYLVEPYLPEFEQRLKGRKDPRRVIVRGLVKELVYTTLGIRRLQNRVRDWDGPSSPVEQRAEAVLESSSHFRAVAHEWYAIPDTAKQVLSGPPMADVPLKLLHTQFPPGEEGRGFEQVFKEFAESSKRGSLVKLGTYDHSALLKPGPALEIIADGILSLTKPAP
jgi:pimeloyl-ACP methyl ester carboxylesterase